MAEKRMLSRAITEHDNFVALPPAAQALYMHLTLSADDDGFCSQISTAMYRAHAKKKDLEALVDARYLIRFPSGVICIKHWRMANAGRADRYTPTVYQEEYQRLTIKGNKAYTMASDGSQTGNQMSTNGEPSGVGLATQKRREEKRREENIYNTQSAPAPAREEDPDQDDGFDAFWAAFPRKSGDIKGAYMEYLHALDTGATTEAIMAGLKWQAEEWKQEGQPQFIPSPEKWLANRRWEEKKREKAQKPNQVVASMDYSGRDMNALLAGLDRI